MVDTKDISLLRLLIIQITLKDSIFIKIHSNLYSSMVKNNISNLN